MQKTKEVQALKLAKGDTLVLKPNRPMTKAEFDLLADQVESTKKKNGHKIVLIPFSTEVAEVKKAAAKKSTAKKSDPDSK